MAQDDTNVGVIDRIFRIVVGILGMAWAMQLGFADTGWNWIGWFAMIPMLAGLVGVCPLYNLLGVRTCAAR